jgi:tetratricopeptide (TPR) repeat protein
MEPGGDGHLYLSYREFIKKWRAFNYAYLLVYPPEMETQVQDILGDQADEARNYQHAVNQANLDIANLTSNRDLFFAWFNLGTSLSYQEKYLEARAAYDQAFTIYQTLAEDQRPLRMLWYQTRPYWVYYYTGSFQEVVDLANQTLDSAHKPILEESFYWRALAREAMGDIQGAIQDLKKAIQINPNFMAGKYQLKRIRGES